jgi:7,8-dihydropterin-6-yl-methyl-4-(beta-D-ribofuranosyl)aminobenzene 5'-phosphate synthase
MGGRITLLTDNTCLPGYECEHGLSILVELAGRSILFDTGQSDMFLRNARRSGRDLSQVDTLVISHSHYDHSSGVPYLFSGHQELSCYFGPGFFQSKYSLVDEQYVYKGAPFTENECTEAGWKVIMVSEGEPVLPLYSREDGIYLVSGIPMEDPFEQIDPRFYIEDADELNIHRDSFEDELVLVIETGGGLIVILGCSHRGVVNTLSHIKRMFDKPLYRVIGGAHLESASPERIEHVAERLKELSIEQLVLCHCTGQAAQKRFSSAGIHMDYGGAGTELRW